MNKIIIKDWAANLMPLGTFATYEDAFAAIDDHCRELVMQENPRLDPNSDAFGVLMDIECGEYQTVEVEE